MKKKERERKVRDVGREEGQVKAINQKCHHFPH